MIGTFCTAIGSMAGAAPVSLDLAFAGVDGTDAESAPDFNSNVNGNNTIRFGVVGNDGSTDIYADLVRTNGTHLKGGRADRNGSRVDPNFGDVGLIHGMVGTSATYALTLYSDAYTTQYSNAEGFDWSLTFLDIDGGAPQDTPSFYDEVVLYTPGVATVGSNSVLNTSVDASGTLTVDGAVAGEVGGTAFDDLTVDAMKVALGYTLTNTSQMVFGWNVMEPGVNSSIDGFQRTLFFSGDLLFDDDTIGGTIDVGSPTPVPLPASALLLIAGLNGLRALRRKS